MLSKVTPFEASLMACDCHEGELIVPDTPLITANALLKVTVPKFATGAMLPLTNVGASTIHSAEFLWARGFCVAAEVLSVLKESFAGHCRRATGQTDQRPGRW